MEFEKRGLIFVFLTAVISGFSIFINKFGVSGIDSSVFAFSKNVLVAIFLLSIIMLVGNLKTIKSLKTRQWVQLSVIGLVGGSIPFLMFFRGLQLTTGTSASLIHKAMFIFVAIGAFYFLKEKINKRMILGALLLLLGNGLLLRFGFNGFGAGELLVFGAMLLWAAEQVISKHVLKELSGNVVAFGRMFFGSLFIMVYLLFVGKAGMIFSLSSSQLLWIVVTSVFLLMYSLTWYNGLKYVNVSVATSVLLLGSVVTTLFNFAFLNAVVTPGEALGMAMLLVGTILIVGFTNIKNLFTVKNGWN